MLDKPTASVPVTVALKASALVDALKRVRHAILHDEHRPYLQGVLLESEPETGRLLFTATDGHRLSTVYVNGISPAMYFDRVIIPAQAVADVLKSEIGKSKSAPWAVTIDVTSSCVAFSLRDTRIECEPITGMYPDYRLIIPAPADFEATIDRELLRLAMAGIAAAQNKACDRARAVKFKIRGDELTVSSIHLIAHHSSTTPLICSATLPLKAPAKDFDIGFNAEYVRDVCAAIQGDTVTINTADADSPARFTGTELRDAHALHVVMPCRV